jgi:hypothetical protein
VKNDLYIPSYNQGFASCAAESEHPEVWRASTSLWLLTRPFKKNDIIKDLVQNYNAVLSVEDNGATPVSAMSPMGWSGFNSEITYPRPLCSVNRPIPAAAGWMFSAGWITATNNYGGFICSGSSYTNSVSIQYANTGAVQLWVGGNVRASIANAAAVNAFHVAAGQWSAAQSVLWVDDLRVAGAGALPGGVGTTIIGRGLGSPNYALNGIFCLAGVGLGTFPQVLLRDPFAPFRLRRRVFAASLTPTTIELPVLPVLI